MSTRIPNYIRNMEIKQSIHQLLWPENLEFLTRSQIRNYPGVLGRIACTLYVDSKNRKTDKTLGIRMVDQYISKKLADASEAPLPQPDHERIRGLYATAARWHGTGRLQTRNGTVVDILAEIAQSGGLLPHRDPIDLKTGDGDFISTSRARMYARPYADMHHDRQKALTYRYGTPSFWGKYFMGSVPYETLLEAKLWRRQNRDHYRQIALPAMIQWRDKVNIESYRCDIYDALDRGSDIPGNYPILVGLSDTAFEEVAVSKAIGRHESRSRQLIPLIHVTHLEVPLEHIAETCRIFEDAETPVEVIPIEHGERYCSQLSFSDLVSGRLLA